MNLAFKISPALQSRGLDMKDVSERTLLSLEKHEGIESGRYKGYRISTIEMLCEAIGCEPGELFVWQTSDSLMFEHA